MSKVRIVGLILLFIGILMWFDAAPFVGGLDLGYLSGFLGQTSAWWTYKLLSIITIPLSLMMIRR